LNEKGKIIITTSLISGEDGQQISERTSVKISITDNGCGIPENIQNNIFDPFFTTKAVGQGTGLGLSIAYQFIRRHDGQINFTSKVNEGTTFEIILPVNI
jgi:signal transduction histidine kinase